MTLRWEAACEKKKIGTLDFGASSGWVDSEVVVNVNPMNPVSAEH